MYKRKRHGTTSGVDGEVETCSDRKLTAGAHLYKTGTPHKNVTESTHTFFHCHESVVVWCIVRRAGAEGHACEMEELANAAKASALVRRNGLL